jgi:pimeloyl-ACP methyl ester carboxylesterase
VFVHGLVESDESWWSTTPDGARTSFGHQLAEQSGLTPVYLRYNSGRALRENAEALAELIEQLRATWPVPVDRIDLVGHSMGGLVAHQACSLAARSGAAWVDVVRTVIALGTPHRGAPLAKSVPIAEWGLTRHPISAPIAQVLAGRSAGIRALHHGALPSSMPGHISYLAVAASLTRNPRHPAGWLVGDGMVRPASALVTSQVAGQLDHAEPASGQGHRLGGVSHQGLLAHPTVAELLHTWLSR